MVGTCPPFTLNGNRFDQGSYEGRFLGFLDVVDPRTLTTSDAELAAAQALLSDFKARGEAPPGTSDEDLWQAKKIVTAVRHGRDMVALEARLRW